MQLNTFVLQPNQGASIGINFYANPNEEIDIDLLISGSYIASQESHITDADTINQQSVNSRIAHRLHYWNNHFGPTTGYTISQNTTQVAISYDLVCCYKAQVGDPVFIDASSYDAEVVNNPNGILAGYKIYPANLAGPFEDTRMAEIIVTINYF